MVSAFKGNKAALASKACAACGRLMTWRKRWARSWDEVKFCSDGCRKRPTGNDKSPAAVLQPDVITISTPPVRHAPVLGEPDRRTPGWYRK